MLLCRSLSHTWSTMSRSQIFMTEEAVFQASCKNQFGLLSEQNSLSKIPGVQRVCLSKVPHFSFQLQNVWEKDQSLGKDLFYVCVSVKIMSTKYSVSCDL